MGLLEQGKLSEATDSVAGGEQGQRTRNLTLLPTDKTVTSAIILIPMSLIIVANFLAPAAFNASSLFCTKGKFYTTPAEAGACIQTTKTFDEGTRKWVKVEEATQCRPREPYQDIQVGGSIDDARGLPSNNARQYYNNYCWEDSHLVHYDYTDHVVNASLYSEYSRGKKEVYTKSALQFGYQKAVKRDSLVLQKYWLYAVVLLTFVAASPQIYWSHVADDVIEPELRQYREAVTKMLKALYICAKQGKTVEEFFKFNRGNTDEIDQQIKKEEDFLLELSSTKPKVATTDSRQEGVLEATAAAADDSPLPASRDNLVKKESAEFVDENAAGPDSKESNAQLVTTFASIGTFFKFRSATSDLSKMARRFRLMNMVSMCVTIVILAVYSLGNTRSSFTCKVDFSADYYEYVICSVSGVGLRLDMTKFWILCYFGLIAMSVIGSIHENRKFKNLIDYEHILDIFEKVWPEKFADLARDEGSHGDDLKYLTMLAAENAPEKPVRALFSLMHFVSIEIEGERKKLKDNARLLEEFDSTLGSRRAARLMEMLRQHALSDNSDIAGIISSLD